MTIDPELLRLIQVEGITDEDYRRVQPKIEAVKQMALFSYSGLFVFDFFKMDFYYIAPNTFGEDENVRNAAREMGLDFFISHASAVGIDNMWMASAYMQNFYKTLSPEKRYDYMMHTNYSAMCQKGKRMLNSKFTPLEFAPDGRVWLGVEGFTTSPESSEELFAIQNIKTNEIRIYEAKSNTWRTKILKPLSTTGKSVLTLMAQGKSVKSIAIELNKSEDTIRSHQKALFKKLDAHTAIEAIGTAKKYRMM